MDHHDAAGRQKLDLLIHLYDRHEVQSAEKKCMVDLYTRNSLIITLNFIHEGISLGFGSCRVDQQLSNASNTSLSAEEMAEILAWTFPGRFIFWSRH